MMVIGMPCGKCCECGKPAESLIMGKPYCYKCGKPHVSEAAAAAAASLKRGRGS